MMGILIRDGLLAMQPIAIPYVYNLGKVLQKVHEITDGQIIADVQYDIYTAEQALNGLVRGSIYSPVLIASRASCDKVIKELQTLLAVEDRTRKIEFIERYEVQSKLREFETIFSAEMDVANVFLITRKGGYNLADLIFRAEVLFPSDLAIKVPEAIKDAQEAGRCLAFDLATAAAFHLHRVNESVVHRYFDAVTDRASRPSSRNIGDYLAKLDSLNAGDAKVKSALRDLKDLHRNPIIHPGDSLESIDEAIALLGSVHAIVMHMLKVIPMLGENPCLGESATPLLPGQ